MRRRTWWHKSKQERFITDQEDEGVNFVWTCWRKTDLTEQLHSGCMHTRMYNRLEDNFHLSNKKALFMNLQHYYRLLKMDPFEVAIPLTFHIKSVGDASFKDFIA